VNDTTKRTQQFRYAVWLAEQEGKIDQAVKEMAKVTKKGDESAFYQEQIDARKLLDQWTPTEATA
jgi:hypothetical protein